MKIIILSLFSGHVERGVENWVHQFSQELGNRHEIIVLSTGSNYKKNLNYSINKIDISVNLNRNNPQMSLLRRLFLDYWSIKIAFFTFLSLSYLNKSNGEIVIPTNGGWQTFIVKLFCLVKRTKIVVVGHSGIGWDDRINLYCFPDLFISLSKKASSWAKKTQPFIKIVNIPNGIDLDLFTKPRKIAKLSLARPLFLAVGALEKGKRLHLAIRAVSKTNKGSLVILGSGALKTRLEKLGNKLLPGRFLLKSVPFEKMPQYYYASDVFTLPSWEREAFGLVYLEAMACGLPVVATNDSQRKELIGKAGILVDPTNEVEYANALLTAAGKNWENAPHTQANNYSWAKIAKRYEEEFTNLIK